MPALDFPANPTNGQVYEDYYYDATIASWRSLGSIYTPDVLRSPLFVSPNSTTAALTAQGATSQTGDIMQFKDSAGTVTARIKSDGSISAVAPTASTVMRPITVSTSNPSGGTDGDVWLVYVP